MSTPLVSVILPTHNRAGLLSRAIRSVLAQTWESLELIVVDDASTDDTPAVVAAFTDVRLLYLRNEGGRYAAGARNTGLRLARGEFIAFQDDDDIWRIDKLERQMAALLAAPPDVGMNICGYICQTRTRCFYVGGQTAFRHIDWRVIRVMKDSALIATPGWLLRRSALEAAGGGFDERLRTWEDWELSLRLAQVCRIAHLDEPLFVQDRVRPPDAGLAHAEQFFAHSLRIILDRHAGLWHAHPLALARHYLAAGYYETLHGSAAEGRQWLRRALRLRPLTPWAWVIYTLGLLGEGRVRCLRAAWQGFRQRLSERLRLRRGATDPSS